MLTRYFKKVCSSKMMQCKTANVIRDMKDTRNNQRVYDFIAK